MGSALFRCEIKRLLGQSRRLAHLTYLEEVEGSRIGVKLNLQRMRHITTEHYLKLLISAFVVRSSRSR